MGALFFFSFEILVEKFFENESRLLLFFGVVRFH
jgi:hypothetical protein